MAGASLASILESVRLRPAPTDDELDARWKQSDAAQPDESGYVPFGDAGRMRCGQQCQYWCRYVDGRFGDLYPNLGQGLRFLGHTGMYHSLRIHVDDVDEFVRRYRAHIRSLL
jgi:hypothetical protein